MTKTRKLGERADLGGKLMTREDLKNYYNTQKWIEEQKELYEEQRVRAEELKAVYIDGLPKGKNKPNYAIEELIDQLNEIIEYMKEFQKRQNEIIKYCFKGR